MLFLRWLVQCFAQQLHDECRILHFIGRKNCNNVQMLAGFQDCELAKKLVHRLLIGLWLQDAFRRLGFPGAFLGRLKKTITVAPSASKPLQAKTSDQSLESVAAFFDSTLDESLHGGFLQRTMASYQEAWAKPVWRQLPWSKRPRAHHIQNQATFWRIVKKSLDFVCGGPWAACSMEVVSKPFWFGEHSRDRRFWRNTNSVSEPLAARMDSRFLYSTTCVLDTVCKCTCNVLSCNHLSVMKNHNAEVNM